MTDRRRSPRILAPAGNSDSFLAALAAGADAVYCGLKQFSARMAARNFDAGELARLAELARRRNAEVYVTVNTLVRGDEVRDLSLQLGELSRTVKPDALIIQDLGVIPVARQAGFSGPFHLSTLANVSFPEALKVIARAPFAGQVTRVVLPRELSVDEIQAAAAQCPAGLELETFIHGALCYGVSGRCYWSSYLGGKSGLRGRCVQPCRRPFRQGGADPEAFFSCRDLGLDMLIKVLRKVSAVGTWKIEGRRKGPHYVYYAVTAYRMLRDEGGDPAVKKSAMALLERALGRPTSHYRFLDQRHHNPTAGTGETGSGLLLGTVKGGKAKPFVSPREPLMRGDLLRLGYEDSDGHQLRRVPVSIPKNGRFFLNEKGRGRPASPGQPVFLIDRREPVLAEEMAELERELRELPAGAGTGGSPGPKLAWPRPSGKGRFLGDCTVRRNAPKSKGQGCWLTGAVLAGTSRAMMAETWWWLPPVIWPKDADGWGETVAGTLARGGRKFVLNAPWQTALFPNRDAEWWAGPFCNFSNPFALQMAAEMGFAGAIVSPELGKSDVSALPGQSPLPLGVVTGGHWPLCVSRTAPEGLQPGKPFFSPRNEAAWAVRHGSDFWLFPNWPVDLSAHREALKMAGYRLFVYLGESVPAGVPVKKRPGLWNWELGLS